MMVAVGGLIDDTGPVAAEGLVAELLPRFGIEVELSFEPGLPSLQDVGPVLLGRVGTLFLNVRPRASKNRQSVVVPVETPRSARS